MKNIVFFLLVIVAFGCKKESTTEIMPNKKAEWIKQAFLSLERGDYPDVKAISWWHEDFDNSQLKINSSTESLKAYKVGVSSPLLITTPLFIGDILMAPNEGIYHAAFPDFGGTEDIVTNQSIIDFENLVGKEITWAYFSNNWYDDILFPTEAVEVILSLGKTPFIRMMARSNFSEGGADPVYTMQRIIEGDFDDALIQWALDAKDTNMPLLVEFGTEVNGQWFPWNGLYNGAGVLDAYGENDIPDGPERFRDAYRHIIDLCRENGVDNVTWFYHVDAYSDPEEEWNTILNYYPGDDYIDWLGVSIYGPQEKEEDYQSFSEIMDDVYPQLKGISDKPIAILEFAITELD